MRAMRAWWVRGSNKGFIGLGALALAVVVAAGMSWWWYGQQPQDEADATGVAFELADVAQREFEGSPALALSFTLPLDAGTDYGPYLQVLQMPPRANEPTPRADTDEDGDQDAPPDKRKDTGVSRAEQDTATEGGTPVEGAWVVGDNPRLLFFPHVKPRTRYVLRVLPGLPAHSGASLASEERYAVHTAAVVPAYYFASRGMVLPASQNGGLPVVTVNVPEVDIQFLKVKPEQLPGFLEKVIAGAKTRATPRPPEDEDEEGEGDYDAYYDRGTRLQGAVNGWTLDQFHQLTTSVFVGRFLTEQQRDKRKVSFIPVETIPALKEPGVYIAVMSQPNRFRHDYQVSYFYVSDLGLHVRQYANRGADAFISSLTDGQAVSGVEVRWLGADGAVLAQAHSDAQGRAAFAERPKDARVVVAQKGDQLSLIALKEPALDLAEFDTAGMTSAPVRLFAYSGRNLYRPGEALEVSVLARDADGRAVPAQPIQALLRRPDGKAQWTATWQPHERFGGYYRQRIELPADAATGSWGLELRADPAAKTASTVLRLGVEEFLPERMKLDLGSDAALVQGSLWNIAVQGNYLYGAPAAGNELLGVLNTERHTNPLEKQLPGFVFGDANDDSVRSRTELEKDALDEQGQARASVALQTLEKRQSPMRVRATFSLLESGGRPVVRSIERTWWPAPALVGLRPLFNGAYAQEGSTVGFEVLRANPQAQLLAAATLPVRLFRENRDYYWRFDDQRGWHSGFTETDELVATTQVRLAAGQRGKLALPVKYGRYRLEVLDPDTGLSTRYRFYAGWFAKDEEGQGVRPDRVALKLDKAQYADGDTVRLTITPPHAGQALVAVEGDGLLWSQRLAVAASGTTIDIPLDKAWRRHDLYITAMVLRPGNASANASTAGVTPARALGLVHLPLARQDRQFQVTLDAPKKMAPDQPLKVKVRVPQAKGQTTVLTLSAVDAGILNITNYKSPDPFGFFFGKLRYAHDLYDVYGRLIEKLAGQRGQLKWGGDGAPKPSKDLPKKVRLVDLFSGPVALDANGEAEVSLPVPDFNGSLRLMAVAASAERFGMAEGEVTVAAPLVVELATPRFLSVGDSALLALDVHNLAGASQDVKISLRNKDGLVIRGTEHKFSLKDQQKRVLRVPLEAGSALGLTEVLVRIESPLTTLERRFALQVQAPTPRQTTLKRYSIPPGDTLDLREADLGGLLRQSVLATLSVSDKPPIDVKSAVHGLLTYPYGCAEQTTSTAYPHVFIDEAAAKQFGLKTYSQGERAEMLDKAIARLAGMQSPNGGFSLWGNGSEYQYWLSAYVSHFLLDAREQGFAVPAELEKKAVDFLLKGLQEGVAGLPRGPLNYNENSVWSDWRYAGAGRFGVLAYGAYVLARHGKAPLATLRQMHEVQEQAHSGLALVHLGLALKLMGDEPRAKTAIGTGVGKPRTSNYWWGDYGSNLRDWALMYVLLSRHGVEVDGRENLVGQVAGEIEKNRYLSTQEKLAVFLLGRGFASAGASEWAAELLGSAATGAKARSLGGKGTQFQALSAAELATGVKLKNTHKERLFVELNLGGNPSKMPAARRDVFDVERTWYSADGQRLGSGPLKVGDTLLVHLRVNTRGRYGNALVVDYVPAGVEIENANLVQGEANTLEIDKVDVRAAMQDSRIKHQEFRDDRFVVAARLEGSNHFFYRVRVVTPGKFVQPPTFVEDMYQPMIYGLAGGGDMVTVVDGKPEGKR